MPTIMQLRLCVVCIIIQLLNINTNKFKKVNLNGKDGMDLVNLAKYYSLHVR